MQAEVQAYRAACHVALVACFPPLGTGSLAGSAGWAGPISKSRMKVAFLGLGKMGSALALSLLKTKKYSRIFAYDPFFIKEKRALSPELEQISFVKRAGELEKEADILLLCVKPQDLPLALEDLEGNKRYISIIAGQPLAMLCYWLKTTRASVARVMPNLAALVSHSVNAIYCEDEELFQLSESLFAPLGYSFRVFKEEELHSVTALSGSGPALVAAFVQALTEGGVLTGLEYKRALQLALETIEGSVKLMKEKKLEPSQLRTQVSSPAGTTIAALHQLEERSFQGSIMAALEAAVKRSKELERMRQGTKK